MKRSRKSRGRKCSLKRSRKSRGRKYNFYREFGFFEQIFLKYLVGKIIPLLHRIGAESHIIRQFMLLGYKYVHNPTYYSISLMYRLIEDILTDGFKLRAGGELFSLTFYQAGNLNKDPIDTDIFKGKILTVNGSYQLDENGEFVSEFKTD